MNHSENRIKSQPVISGPETKDTKGVAAVTIRIDSSQSLPFLESFRPQDRKVYATALAHSNEQRRKAFESRDQAASKLAADFHAAVRKSLGQKNYTMLRDAMARERLAYRELWQPPLKPGRDDRKENAARKSRVDAVLKKLGSSADALRAIGRKFDRQSQALVTGTGRNIVPGYSMDGHLDRWSKLSPLNTRALPWGDLVFEQNPDDPHRWFCFRPPFFGFNFQFASSCTQGYTADRIHFVDPPAGLIGYRAMLTSHDEREYEFGALGVISAIAFRFEAPIAGLVEILVDVQSAVAHHHVEMDDEWGYSESTTWQQNSITMDVLHPNTLPGTEALMSDFRTDFDGDDATVDRDYLVHGRHYFAQSMTSGPIAAGQSVVVQIGTFGADTSKLNDVGVKSESHFRWFVSSVQVRIAT